MDIIISLIALFISILSFVLSFLQSHDVKMTVNKIEIKNLNDSFALLFDGNNKIKIGLVMQTYFRATKKGRSRCLPASDCASDFYQILLLLTRK